MTRVGVVLLALALVPAAAPSHAAAPALPSAVAAPPAASPAPARSAEAGRPFIRKFLPKEYGALEQNWTIAQDDRGVLYVGNSVGLLEYDGATWRFVTVPNKSTIRSIVNDGHGRMYLGAVSEFGYLAPDASGTMQFVSLLDHVPPENRSFGDVWRTLVASDGVYFQSQQYLFRWAGGRITVIKPISRFHRASVVNGTIYIGQPETGLMKLVGDTLISVPGGHQFASETRPVVLPYDDRRILVGTRADGLYLGDDKGIARFPTEVDAWMKSADLYRGTVLPDGTLALASTGGGLAIIDKQGRLLQRLDASTGLADVIYYVYPDGQGGLWVGYEGGIARVETPSPVSLHEGTLEFPANGVQFMRRHQGRLYAATSRGVFVLAPPSSGSIGAHARAATFQRVSGVSPTVQCWWLETVDNPAARGGSDLLVASGDGVYRIDGDRAFPVYESVGGSFLAAALHRSKVDPSRVFVGLFDGLASLRLDKGKWQFEGRVSGVTEEVRTIAEDANGRLWLGTAATGVLRVTFGGPPAPGQRAPFTLQPAVERFGVKDGLAAGGVYVTPIAGGALFGTPQDLYRFDEARHRFVTDPTFKFVGVDSNGFGGFVWEAANGDVWVNLGRESGVARKKADGSYTFETRPFQRFANFSVTFIYPDDDGVAWFSGRDGLVRYDPAVRAAFQDGFASLIRRVALPRSRQLYGGGAGRAAASPDLRYENNAVRFEFAAPAFTDETANRFQTWLEGLDRDWSEWARETSREFTSLPPGKYTFHVRAKDLYGQVGREAVYSFSVLPPWYRTWWAYGAYLVLLGLAVFGVDRLQRWRLLGKERERSRLKETQLRAEAAEALARSERERTKTVEQLSEIGKEITSSLDVDTIFARLYERVNQFADAAVFGVGLYDAEKREIEYRLAFEEGKRYKPYTRDASDRNQFPVWCIENRKPVFINDVATEYGKYISRFDEAPRALEDGSMSRKPESLLYLPLLTQDRVLGVITIQSFRKHAYTEYHLNLLQNLAAYTSIALDNANAYRQLDEQAKEIEQRAAELATIDNISRALASELELGALIQLVGEQVRQVFDAQVAYLALLDKATGTIHFRYGYGDAFPALPLGTGMTSRILQTGEPLLINQDISARTAQMNITRSGVAAKSYLGVPIPVGNEVIGVLSVQSTEEEGRFSGADLRLLTTIAANVGVAIHNARLFEEAQQARAAAEEADKAKSAFLSTVSHELRTPLTSVLGFAKIIKKRLEDRIFPLLTTDDRKVRQTIQQVGENLDVVVSEGERLTKLIDDVLDLAKIEAGKLEWHMESVAVGDVVDRAASATSSLFAQKGLAFEKDVADGLPPVLGDANRLLQVVINLISNAVKFTDAGSVTCRARLQDDGITVSVIDTGVGIAPDDQPKVFEKFKQVGDTLTDKPKGTGLGLPICREIVEHHGGRIWVESEPGRGSTFSFLLPVQLESSVPVGPVSLEVLVRQLGEPVATRAQRPADLPPCVLAVDDDPHIRTLLEQEFTEAGFRVRLAANGREGLAEVRCERPDLIVLDVMMPEINGFDVAAVLKNDPHTMDIPIIILSVVEDRTRGFRLGVDRYLTKPIDTVSLLKEARALLEQGPSAKRVLVVDEDASAAKMLTDVLQARGYSVTEVDAAQFVARAVSVKPDIIVVNALLSEKQEVVQALRFEKGLENVLFLVYQ